MTHTNSLMQKGSGIYTCGCCGLKTRAIGNKDCEHVKLCSSCYDLAGYENQISDSGIESLTEDDHSEIVRLVTLIRAKGGKVDYPDGFTTTTSPITTDEGTQRETPAPLTTEEAPKARKAFEINPANVHPEMLSLFEDLASRAVEEKITASKAIRAVLMAFPNATRVHLKHTAALAGINPLTARNAFDKISGI